MKNKLIAGACAIACLAGGIAAPADIEASAKMIEGDIDQDGVITGHDTAMLSACLYGYRTLDDTQKELADFNCDGVLNQEDVETIHGLEAYAIGATIEGFYTDNDGHTHYVKLYNYGGVDSETGATVLEPIYDKANIISAWNALNYYSKKATGSTPEVNQVQLNLWDVTGNDIVDIDDAYGMLQAYANYAVSGDIDEYYYTGRYDLNPNAPRGV